MVCSLGTLFALTPSMFGVHSGGNAFGSDLSVSSMYFSFSSSGLPLSGKMLDIACGKKVFFQINNKYNFIFINTLISLH